MEIPEYYYNPIVRRKMKIIDALIALIVIVLGIISFLSYNYFKIAISAEVLFSGYLAMFFFAFILDSLPQFVSPFLIIVVALASGFNLTLVLIVVLIGSILGNILGFYIGRKYGLKVVAALFSKKNLQRIFNFSEKNGKFLLILTHFTPIPYFPIVFGALEIRKRDFALYGILLRLISFSLGAYGVAQGLISYPLPF